MHVLLPGVLCFVLVFAVGFAGGMHTPQPLTILWLGLGLVGGAALLAYSKRFGRARRKLLGRGLVVAAGIYVLFALRTGLSGWLLYESLGVLLFLQFHRLGMARSPEWLAAGWALHPAWDAGLHLRGPGAAIAPEWYVLACISFDLLVAAGILFDREAL